MVDNFSIHHQFLKFIREISYILFPIITERQIKRLRLRLRTSMWLGSPWDYVPQLPTKGKMTRTGTGCADGGYPVGKNPTYDYRISLAGNLWNCKIVPWMGEEGGQRM